MKVNDYDIIAIIPVLNDQGTIIDHVIVGDRPSTDTAVTARMVSLDDTQWFWGNYFHGTPAERRPAALNDAAQRASLITAGRTDA